MYFELTIEMNDIAYLDDALQEIKEVYQLGTTGAVIRPHYAIRLKRRKSYKRTYWYVNWDNYMGRGCVRSIKLTKDEYNRLKGNGGNRELIKGLPNIWPYKTELEAECALDRKYQD